MNCRPRETAKQRSTRRKSLARLLVIALVCVMTTSARAAGPDAYAAPVGTINTPVPTFVWNRVSGASDYLVSIISSSRATAAHVVVDKNCVQTTCSTELKIPDAGQLQSYAWTVTARKDSKTAIQTSPAYQFTVIPPSMQIQSAIVSPTNNETVIDPVEFKWQQSRGADVDGYEIVVTDQQGNKHTRTVASGRKGGGAGGQSASCASGICSALSNDGKQKMALKHQFPDGRPNVHTWTVSTITTGGKRSAPSLPKTFIPAGAIALEPANNTLTVDPVEFKWRQNPARDVQGYEIIVTGQDGSKQAMTVSGNQEGGGGKGSGYNAFNCPQGVCSSSSLDAKRQGFKFNLASDGRPTIYSWTISTLDSQRRRSEPSAPLTFIPTAAVANSPADNETVIDPVEFKWQQSRSADVDGYEIVVTDQQGSKHTRTVASGRKGGGAGGQSASCASGICSALSNDGKQKMALKHQFPDGRPNVHTWTVSTITTGGKRSAPSLPKTFIPAGAIALEPANNNLTVDPVEFKWRQNPARDVKGYEIVVTGQDGSKQAMTVSGNQGGGDAGGKATGYNTFNCPQGVCSSSSLDAKKQGFKFNLASDGKPVIYSWTVSTLDAQSRRSEPSAPLTFIPTAAVANSPADNETVIDPVEFKWQQSRGANVDGYEIVVTDQQGNKHTRTVASGRKGGGAGGQSASCASGICSALSNDGKQKMALKHQFPDGRPNVHTWTVSTITTGGKRSAPSLPKTFIPAGAISISPDNLSVLYPVEFKWRQNPARDVKGYEIIVTGQDGSKQAMTVSGNQGGGDAGGKATGYNTFNCPQGVCTAFSNDKKQGLKLSRASDGKSVLYSWTVSAIDGQNRRGEPSTPKTFIVQ